MQFFQIDCRNMFRIDPRNMCGFSNFPYPLDDFDLESKYPAMPILTRVWYTEVSTRNMNTMQIIFQDFLITNAR